MIFWIILSPSRLLFIIQFVFYYKNLFLFHLLSVVSAQLRLTDSLISSSLDLSLPLLFLTVSKLWNLIAYLLFEEPSVLSVKGFVNHLTPNHEWISFPDQEIHFSYGYPIMGLWFSSIFFYICIGERKFKIQVLNNYLIPIFVLYS